MKVGIGIGNGNGMEKDESMEPSIGNDRKIRQG